MSFYSEQFLMDMDEILLRCDRILENHISDTELSVIKRDMEDLKKQSELYYENLKDQIKNSKLDFSRKLAAIVLKEDENIENFFESYYSVDNFFGSEISMEKMNEIALYVEYLSGRAKQAFRDALIGAMGLKLLAETNCKKQFNETEE